MDKMAKILQMTNDITWNLAYFYSYLTEVSSWGFDWKFINIGSGNGLVLNRRQIIIWANDKQYFVTMWCH